MATERGVKKVSELILARKRGAIITEKGTYDWENVPPGSKFINTVTGNEQVKLRDTLIDKATGANLGYGIIHEDDLKVYHDDGTPILKSNGKQYTHDEVKLSNVDDWVKANVKNDGALCIAKDSMIIEEVFTIFKPDDGEGNMEYLNTDGQHRRFPIMSDGSVVFELEKGPYCKGRNHLEVLIDDTLRRTVSSGGLTELTERRFALSEPLKKGQEITARYVRLFRYGNPYPRIFIDTNTPAAAEVGDLWIDFDDYINTDIGLFIDKTILSDEPLDGGFQPKEPGGAPNDIKS